MLSLHGGRGDALRFPAILTSYEVEEMRLALHGLTHEPGMREDFLVRALIRELDTVLEDQLENFGRNKARARDHARALELVLSQPRHRARYLVESGISERQAHTLLGQLRQLADTAGGIEELARRKRALDAWRELAEPVLAPDLLREWREAQISTRGE